MPQFARRRPVLILFVLFGLAAALAMRFEAPEPAFSAHAAAVDGDTLRIGGKRVRLLGIDAPELGQTCTGADGADWPCGEVARSKMVALLGGGQVTCQPRGHDRYGRVLAHCLAAATDLGEAMVAGGFAVADGDYFHEESVASTAKTGIWAGAFVPPAQWREAHNANGGEPGFMETIKAWFR